MRVVLSGWGKMGVKRFTFATCLGVSSLFLAPLILLVIDLTYVMMTDASDIVNEAIGSALGISSHCFVQCEVLVEQVRPEHNVRHVVHLN